jgi:hypothetical protein
MKVTFKEQSALNADKLAKSRSNGGQAAGRRHRLNKLFGFHGCNMKTTRFDVKKREP